MVKVHSGLLTMFTHSFAEFDRKKNTNVLSPCSLIAYSLKVRIVYCGALLVTPPLRKLLAELVLSVASLGVPPLDQFSGVQLHSEMPAAIQNPSLYYSSTHAFYCGLISHYIVTSSTNLLHERRNEHSDRGGAARFANGRLFKNTMPRN